MKIYKLWFMQCLNKIFIKECDVEERRCSYLVDDFHCVKKDDIERLDKWGEMYSFYNNDETIKLFKELHKEVYSEELRRAQESLKSIENAEAEIYE